MTLPLRGPSRDPGHIERGRHPAHRQSLLLQPSDLGLLGRQGGRATGPTPQASALGGFLREP